MDNKTSLRLKAKNIRNNLAIKQISKNIVYNLTQSDIFITSNNIMFFYPLEKEINLLDLLNFEDKNFYLPRINGKNLECCPYKKGDNLIIKKYNIKDFFSSYINPCQTIQS